MNIICKGVISLKTQFMPAFCEQLFIADNVCKNVLSPKNTILTNCIVGLKTFLQTYTGNKSHKVNL